MRILLVEDNERLRPAMKNGLEAVRISGRQEVQIIGDVASGEAALDFCLTSERPDAILMDVQLAGQMNGVEAAIAIRREFPRVPVGTPGLMTTSNSRQVDSSSRCGNKSASALLAARAGRPACSSSNAVPIP